MAIAESDKELSKKLYLRLSDVLSFATLLGVNFDVPLKYQIINNGLNDLERAEG